MTATYTSVFGSDTVPPAGQSYLALSLTADTTYYWPELATGDVLANINDVTATSTWVLTLPAANLTSTGRDLLFRNVGAQTVTINDNAGGAVATLAAGEVKYLYITDNSTAAGLWAVFTFGTGTSAADASALAGSGIVATGSTLSQQALTISSAVTTTVTTSQRAETLIFTNSGVVTCNMPTAASAGNGFFINISNQGTGTVTIDPSGAETIDGATTKDLAPGESLTAVCSGTAWASIGYGRSTQFQFTKLVLDISAGSPFTLTSVQAQNKLIQTIGTITAGVTINVPAVVAVYYIECSHTGAFTTTFKTAAGAGIALNANDRSILYCDGVDVVQAQTATVPVANLSGGAAGEVVYQTGVGTTGYTAAGTTGQVFISGGSGSPTWSDLGLITNGYSSKVTPVDSDALPLSDSAAAFGPKKLTWANLKATLFSTVGNLTFTGTGNRITGDFSNATDTNRPAFQSSTVNGNTLVNILPNGSSVNGGIFAYNNSTPTNCAYIGVNTAGGTEARFSSGVIGSGTYLPMTFYTGGSERMRIDTNGNVGIGTGGAVATTLDMAGSVRPFTFQGASTSTTVSDGSGGVVLVNAQTTTNNFSSIVFAAITGANANYYASGLIQVQHGARSSGQYHSGAMIFSTAPGSNIAPTESLRISTDGTTTVSKPAGLGYGTGAGGAVTQATNKSTAVTLNKPTGQVLTNTAALGAGASVVFRINNSLITTTDVIAINVTLNPNHMVSVQTTGAGYVDVRLTNISGGSLSDGVYMQFAILKGAVS